MAAAYIDRQRKAGFPFGSGDNRWQILKALSTWIGDPGPLNPRTRQADR